MLILLMLLASATSYCAEAPQRPVSPRIEDLKKESVMKEDNIYSDINSCMTCSVTDEEKELFKSKFLMLKRYIYCNRCDKLYIFHPKKLTRMQNVVQ
ncbi:MAG TPA: hypothetical protein VMV86_05895 [Methanosarcinales archaeon]|nr:hypothetical protein [Methanosarcinales archaeon]